MTDEGYRLWKEYHTTLMCIRSSAYNKMLDAMKPLLIRRKVTCAELEAATEWMWEDPERGRQRWGTHGGLLWQRIRRQRAEAEKRAEQARRRKEDSEPNSFGRDVALKLAEKLGMPKEAS